MQVRGAPLIGATAAYGMALALRADARMRRSTRPTRYLLATRPTAVNLRWALDEMRQPAAAAAARRASRRPMRAPARSAEEDVAINQAIGRHGLALIEAIAAQKQPASPSTC